MHKPIWFSRDSPWLISAPCYCQTDHIHHNNPDGPTGADSAEAVGRLLPWVGKILQTRLQRSGKMQQQSYKQPPVLSNQLYSHGHRGVPLSRVSGLRSCAAT